MQTTMQKKLCLLLSLCLLLFSGCNTSDKTIRFGAADVGGMYYSLASSFSALASKDNDNYRFEVKNTSGSLANLRLLSSGYIDLGIAQADLIEDACNGTGDFDGTSYDNFSAVAGLYTEACQIVVRADSGIASIDDLMDKTVSIGAEESGTKRNAEEILQTAGLTGNLVKTVTLDYTQAASELNSGEIDAFFCTAGITTTVIQELSGKCDIRLLPVDGKYRTRLLKAYPFFCEYTIPAGTYTGQDTDIETLGVQAVLLASDNLSETTVKDLTAFLFDHADDFSYSTPLDFAPSVPSAAAGTGLKLHPGAASYYASQGITVPVSTETAP